MSERNKKNRMVGGLKSVGRLFWATIEECVRDNTPMLAAAISFYSILSLVPALWVVMRAARTFVGSEAAREHIIELSTQVMGSRAAVFVGAAAEQASEVTPLATGLGIAGLFLGATMAFSAIYDSLNKIWYVEPPPDRGIVRGFLVKRALAFSVVILMGVLMLASLLVSSILTAAAEYVPAALPAPHLVLQMVGFTVSTFFITLLFAAVYRILHDKVMVWHNVWVGAAVTAVLFEAGKTGISLFLGNNVATDFAGAAGSLAALLLWIYYSAQIFLFGAEFTELYAQARLERQQAVAAE